MSVLSNITTLDWRTVRARLELLARHARLAPALLSIDATVAGWLAMAQQIYTTKDEKLRMVAASAAALVALLGWVWRWHEIDRQSLRQQVLRAAAVAGSGALALLALRRLGLPGFTAGGCVWFGLTAAGLLLAIRVAYLAVRRAHPDQPLEAVRWLLLLGGATASIWPFYFAGSVGAGDAHWYTMMLTDFTSQWRAGVFPVWVGQSIYAFNGANVPLRLAPGFQHAGGLLDLLTVHVLAPLALKNALLAVTGVAAVFSAYACLRAILARNPWLAFLLALLWFECPGVLATLLVGDQYMSFMALPFVPPVLYGCWRHFERGDWPARLLIAAGLAGLWLCHSPVALWCSLLAAGFYVSSVLVRRCWRQAPGQIAGMGALFLTLGLVPFASVVALDNVIKIRSQGESAYLEIVKAFPGNFLPIDVKQSGLQAYQLGYAICLLAVTVGLLAGIRYRPRGSLTFLAGSLALLPFAVPVPWLTRAIWTGLPSWFVSINNVWPMQRLFLIWAAVLVFFASIVLADARLASRRWVAALLGFVLAVSGLWSWREAAKLRGHISESRVRAPAAARMLAPDNLILTRYSYANFAWVPAYVSHSYMAPDLENRLVRPESGEIILSNADAAAPMLDATQGPGTSPPPRLVESGVWTAYSPNSDRNFLVSPDIHLEPDKSYALRIEFTQPADGGVIQLTHDRLFREYYLPDSGQGLGRTRPSRAFGSEPQCSHVMPLRYEGSAPDTPLILYFSREARPQKFPLARYWLYRYEPADLPVVVESWIPYRARVRSPVRAWLETPRVWLPEWQARLNGRPVPVHRSRENLVAVEVPPGESRVELVYHQRSWLNVLYGLSVIGWLGLTILAIGVAVRRAGVQLS
jgi:hypothetical protein